MLQKVTKVENDETTSKLKHNWKVFLALLLLMSFVSVFSHRREQQLFFYLILEKKLTNKKRRETTEEKLLEKKTADNGRDR